VPETPRPGRSGVDESPDSSDSLDGIVDPYVAVLCPHRPGRLGGVLLDGFGYQRTPNPAICIAFGPHQYPGLLDTALSARRLHLATGETIPTQRFGTAFHAICAIYPDMQLDLAA